MKELIDSICRVVDRVYENERENCIKILDRCKAQSEGFAAIKEKFEAPGVISTVLDVDDHCKIVELFGFVAFERFIERLQCDIESFPNEATYASKKAVLDQAKRVLESYCTISGHRSDKWRR